MAQPYRCAGCGRTTSKRKWCSQFCKDVAYGKYVFGPRPSACITCETPITQPTKVRYFCSPQCNPNQSVPRERQPQECKTCGTEFTSRPRVRHQDFCSAPCRYRWRDLRWRMYDEPAGPPAPLRYASPAGPLSPLVCDHCGVDMPASRRNGRCRRCTAYTSVRGLPYTATCDTCAQPFDTVRSQGRYRCPPCAEVTKAAARRQAKRRRRSRKRSAVSEPYVEAVIFARDGWRCQLCGLALGSRPVPHPRAATIDHIVPLACGGADTPANVQAAHFLCNSRKGDRPANDQLRLV